MKKYYTLIAKEPNGRWSPEFGDFERSVVAQEGDDLLYAGWFDKGTKLKVIVTGPAQKEIDAAIAEINARLDARDPTVTKEMADGFSWKGSR
jgi:hypothetical protein